MVEYKYLKIEKTNNEDFIFIGSCGLSFTALKFLVDDDLPEESDYADEILKSHGNIDPELYDHFHSELTHYIKKNILKL